MPKDAAKDSEKPAQEGATEEEVDLSPKAPDIAEQRPARDEYFTLEKILTISAGDFGATYHARRADLHDYSPIGVHHAGVYTDSDIAASKHTMDFAARVPKNAEVVVNYEIIIAPYGDTRHSVVQSGTALVRRLWPADH